jgi:cytochrome P450
MEPSLDRLTPPLREPLLTTDGACPYSYPFSEAKDLELDPTYAKMRAEQPLLRIQMAYGEQGWLAIRHDDARTVLADPRFSRAATLTADLPRAEPELPNSPEMAANITNMDAPEHGRLRSLIASGFTARRLEGMRPFIEETAERLIEEMLVAGGPVNLVDAVSTPLPVIVICELLGVPLEGREIFRTGIEALVSNATVPAESRVSAVLGISTYMAELIDERRRDPDGPRDDLLGALVAARDTEGSRLSEEELVMLGVTLLVAGHETTLNMISNMVVTLLADRSRWDYLVEDSDRVPHAVEEMLRMIPSGPYSGQARVALEDVVLAGGSVRAGEAVLVAAEAANRDPEVFDDPETLHLDREPGNLLTFGYGPHRCVGAVLARMELQIALRTLITKVPSLDLAAEVEWRTSTLIRGPETVLVNW